MRSVKPLKASDRQLRAPNLSSRRGYGIPKSGDRLRPSYEIAIEAMTSAKQQGVTNESLG